jgi:hypothetical protein
VMERRGRGANILYRERTQIARPRCQRPTQRRDSSADYRGAEFAQSVRRRGAARLRSRRTSSWPSRVEPGPGYESQIAGLAHGCAARRASQSTSKKHGKHPAVDVRSLPGRETGAARLCAQDSLGPAARSTGVLIATRAKIATGSIRARSTPADRHVASRPVAVYSRRGPRTPARPAPPTSPWVRLGAGARRW